MDSSNMTHSQYSLRWNNHQTYILQMVGSMLQAEAFLDVTLACSDKVLKAHKLVLSACSPMFRQLFLETPCKHPVIFLKDFNSQEIEPLIKFMYTGEVSVLHEHLDTLMRAAEHLKVRGLANEDDADVSNNNNSSNNNNNNNNNHHVNPPTPSESPNDYDMKHQQYYSINKMMPLLGVTMRTPLEQRTQCSPTCNSFDQPATKLPHMSKLSFQPETLLFRPECHSPQPRRKQARPRRRSGELGVPQDLSTGAPKSGSSTPSDEIAENLCINKRKDENARSASALGGGTNTINSNNNNGVSQSHHQPPSLKEEPGRKSCTPELSRPGSGHDTPLSNSFKDHLHQLPKAAMDSVTQYLSTPPTPSVLASAPMPSKFSGFPYDLPLVTALHPAHMDTSRHGFSYLDSWENRTSNEAGLFTKKKMGRPKGQHSAPRGGPPRSWTNAELTEALQHVWNKKMTTSQASRMFGIPYNSLLMYVRGKYGKSLKLEKLRQDCTNPPQSSMDMLNAMGAAAANNNNNNNNNNNLPKIEPEHLQANTRPSSTDQDPGPVQHPLINPFGHNFYPEQYGTPYSLSMNMFHLLSPAEKERLEQTAYGQIAPNNAGSEDMRSNPSTPKGGAAALAAAGGVAGANPEDVAMPELYRPPSLGVDDRRELIQTSGQD